MGRHDHGHGTRARTGITSQMTLDDQKDIEASIRSAGSDHKKHKHLHHLKKKLLNTMKHANVTDILDKMGKRMPDEVVSLVHSMEKTSTIKTHGKQPFSEKSLAKARMILNGMVEEAQDRLDEKEIECKEFENRNRKAWAAARADQARLAEQITGHITVIGKCETGIQVCTKMIDEVKDTM